MGPPWKEGEIRLGVEKRLVYNHNGCDTTFLAKLDLDYLGEVEVFVDPLGVGKISLVGSVEKNYKILTLSVKLLG